MFGLTDGRNGTSTTSADTRQSAAPLAYTAGNCTRSGVPMLRISHGTYAKAMFVSSSGEYHGDVT